MFPNNPHLHHGTNFVIASIPFIAWISNIQPILAGLSGILCILYYIPIVYRVWKDWLWKSKK